MEGVRVVPPVGVAYGTRQGGLAPQRDAYYNNGAHDERLVQVCLVRNGPRSRRRTCPLPKGSNLQHLTSLLVYIRRLTLVCQSHTRGKIDTGYRRATAGHFFNVPCWR